MKTVVDIKGMTCRSCEMLIEDELIKVAGVVSAEVNHKTGKAKILHNKPISLSEIHGAIEEAGYEAGKDEKSFFSRNPSDYLHIAVIIGFLFIAWVVSTLFGLFDAGLPEFNNYASLPAVLLIGITAGFSTCMALVGGLVLGVSSRFSQKHPAASAGEKFKPHILFNLGRIISFFVFGAVIGFIGSFFKFNPSVLGYLIVFVGVVMFIVGVQLTKLIPGLDSIKFTLPKQISRQFGIKEKNEQEYSGINTLFLGVLTFFLPCGFTQAIQLFAVSTGDPLTASLTMGVFAIGTTPGLLGIGGLTSILRGAFASMFFKFAGVVVIILAIYNIQNGLNLSGFQGIKLQREVLSADNNITDTGKVEVLEATYSAEDGMQPADFTVSAGSRINLKVKAFDDGAGCMGSITVPGLSDKVDVFRKGQTSEFTFTIPSSGDYMIACAMGIPHGTIKAI